LIVQAISNEVCNALNWQYLVVVRQNDRILLPFQPFNVEHLFGEHMFDGDEMNIKFLKFFLSCSIPK